MGGYEYEERTENAFIKALGVDYDKTQETKHIEVCERKYGGYGKECKNVKVHVVKNEPSVNSKIKTAKLTFPESLKKCLSRRIFFPKIACQNKESEKCIKLPVIRKEKVTMKLCKVNPGQKDCQNKTMYLPKTTCRLPPVKKPEPEKPESPHPTYGSPNAKTSKPEKIEKEEREGKALMEDSEPNKESEASDKVEAREGKSIDVEDKAGPGATPAEEKEPEAAAQLPREGKSLEEDEVAVTDEDSQISEQENATEE